MAKFNLNKIKFHPNLQQILLLLLLVTVALEGYVLYQAFFVSVETVNLSAPTGAPVAVRLDMAQYEKIQEWIDANEVYVLPGYLLRDFSGTSTSTLEAIGRENPFAQ